MRSNHPVLVLSAFLCASAVNPLLAEDHFFTFGGGYAPDGNQVSLEKNVGFFRRVLKETGHAGDPQCCLFADGTDPGRDLQFATGELPDRRLGYLLAAIFEKTDDIYNDYRTNELTNLDGPSTPAQIDRYFNDTAVKFDAGDRLLVYYTGHGGRGEKENPQNTSVELWDHQKMRMKEFVTRLDKVPTQVPVVLIMVQCFSGGFANVIFNEGDPGKGLGSHNRVGFFATVHDRTAAGCTPDINEANYQEYSSHFFAALSGHTRLGDTVPPPDFDHDGKVNFDEAHAYALLTSNSIDVSVKTSDAFLRHFSRLRPLDADKEAGVELMSEETHYAALMAAAGPCEKVVLEGLSSRLQLTDYLRVAAARDKARQVEEQRERLAEEGKKLRKEFKEVGQAIAKAVKNRWPEMGNPWHPGVAKIVTRESRKVLAVIEGHERFSRFGELVKRINEIEDERLELERQWAKCQRLIRAAENVALAANLPKVASPEVCDRYAALAAAEHGTLEKDGAK